MLRQAEKRQHREACALRFSKAVWCVSGVSVMAIVNAVQRTAKGERAVGPAVASEMNGRPWGCQEQRLSAWSSQGRESPAVVSEANGTPWSCQEHRLVVGSSQRAGKRRRWKAVCAGGLRSGLARRNGLCPASGLVEPM